MDPRGSGLVAVGDLLVNGYTDAVAKVPGRSFAQWVAQAADVSWVRFGQPDATSDLIASTVSRGLDGDYRYGILAIGTSDARRSQLGSLEQSLRVILAILLARCSAVAVLSVQYSTSADRCVRTAAAEAGVPVVDATLRGRRLLSPDLMHPTALGQLVLADRVAEVWDLPSPSESLLARRGRINQERWPVPLRARGRHDLTAPRRIA